ncbi:MAG: dockerin type I repeat-containing protein, partial [bacterium]
SGDLLFVDPGSNIVLPVTLNATGMTPGLHSGSIAYTCNDLNNSSGTIPVLLYIYAPEMTMPMMPLEEWVESGASTTCELVIANAGPGRLTWSMIADVDNKLADFAKQAVVEPLGFRVADPDKTGVEEPYYAAQEKGSGGPDTFGYTWIDSDESGGPVYSWVDITGVGTSYTLDDDDYTAALPIGFSFPFYENAYTDLYIGSNGVLTFSSGNSTTSNVSIPNTGVPNNMIAMWWDDLDPSSGGTVYSYQDAANGRFIVTFDAVPNYYYSGATGSLTFQAILYANGMMTLQYNSMQPGIDNLEGATIGIENSTGTDGLQVANNQAYMHDALAVNFLGALPWWLTVDPMGGSVEAGESDTVTVSMDAAELVDSTYTGGLLVTTNDPDYQVFSIPVTFHAGVGEPILTGDANGDEIVNITDAVYLIDYIFSSGPGPDPMACGDCNCDDVVNITDATYLIAYIFSDGPPPCEH